MILAGHSCVSLFQSLWVRNATQLVPAVYAIRSTRKPANTEPACIPGWLKTQANPIAHNPNLTQTAIIAACGATVFDCFGNVRVIAHAWGNAMINAPLIIETQWPVPVSKRASTSAVAPPSVASANAFQARARYCNAILTNTPPLLRGSNKAGEL